MHFVCLVVVLSTFLVTRKKVLIRRLKKRKHRETSRESETPKETEVIRMRLFGPLPETHETLSYVRKDELRTEEGP